METDPPSRRRVLRAALALAALATAGQLARPGTARAGNGAKSGFQYQDHPQRSQRGAQCAPSPPPRWAGR